MLALALLSPLVDNPTVHKGYIEIIAKPIVYAPAENRVSVIGLQNVC
jgi:hypothetical protein